MEGHTVDAMQSESFDLAEGKGAEGGAEVRENGLLLSIITIVIIIFRIGVACGRRGGDVTIVVVLIVVIFAGVVVV